MSAEDRAAQTKFFDDFETETEEFETEGAPVKTAEAKAATPAPAQSGDETSDEANLDADKKPVAAPVPPADAKGEAKADEQAPKPATQPETRAPATQEELSVAQTPEQVQQRYMEWRGQTEDLLAKHHYALKQEQIDELDTNPAEFIAKMQARVYLDAVTAVLTQVTQHLPRMIQQQNELSAHSVSNESQFYDRWPKLREHADTVLRVGAVYRQLNPSASMEDFINEVGAQTMVAMRIPPDEMQQQVNGKQPVAPKVTAPFVPATATPAGGAPPSQPKNMFEQLNEEFEEELGDF